MHHLQNLQGSPQLSLPERSNISRSMPDLNVDEDEISGSDEDYEYNEIEDDYHEYNEIDDEDDDSVPYVRLDTGFLKQIDEEKRKG